MLLFLLTIRLLPLLVLKIQKNQNNIRRCCRVLLVIYACLGVLSLKAVWDAYGGRGILYFLLGLFPQSFVYLTAGWLLLRCVCHAWSFRVWRRIWKVSVVIICIGVLLEYYINAGIVNLLKL